MGGAQSTPELTPELTQALLMLLTESLQGLSPDPLVRGLVSTHSQWMLSWSRVNPRNKIVLLFHISEYVSILSLFRGQHLRFKLPVFTHNRTQHSTTPSRSCHQSVPCGLRIAAENPEGSEHVQLRASADRPAYYCSMLNKTVQILLSKCMF